MLETKYGMKYPFPHTLVHIIDNSAYTGDLPVVVADDPSMYGTIVVSGFPMGEDNRMIAITRSDILNIAYGLSGIGAAEIQKFGQTITYPTSLIDQGAPIQLMRVTPSDATYAYSCIVVEWRWDEDESKMHVRYNTAKLDNDRDLMNYKNRDRLAAAIMASVNTDYVDENNHTWKRRAFLVNISAGRGAAYNNFTTSVNQTIQQKKPANVRYLFTTTDMRTNTTVEQYIASLINDNNTDRTDATDNVNVMMGKRADGSSVVVQYLNEAAVRELYNDYHVKYAEIIANNASAIDDYIRNVFTVLNINIFDPIFGLYLYNGTDETYKLPYFQVDMVQSSIPRLPENQRCYYEAGSTTEYGEAIKPGNIQEQTLLISDKLIPLSFGFGKKIGADGQYVDENVLIGDMYLYSGFATTNNPYIYIVAAINQYTGTVTTIRTNQLSFVGSDEQGSEITYDSVLRTIIDAQSEANMLAQLKTKIKNGVVRDKDSIAWFNTTTNTWELYFVNDGVGHVDQDAEWSQAIVHSYVIKYAMNSYNFINWKASNASNLIATSDTDPAWGRVGATCIDLEKEFGDAELVYINGTDTTVENGLKKGTKFFVTPKSTDDPTAWFTDNKTSPPVSISNVVSDMIGTAYDMIECDLENATYYHIKSEIVEGEETSKLTASTSFTADENIRIGWKPYDASIVSNQVIFFTEKTGSLDLTYVSDSDPIDITKSYLNGLEDKPLYVARNIVRAYAYADADSVLSFFRSSAFTSLVGTADNYVDGGSFRKTENGYVLLTSQPEDWVDGTFYINNTKFAASAISESFVYFDKNTSKYYRYQTDAFTEITGLESDDQIMRVYKSSGTSGSWVIDSSDGNGAGFEISATEVNNKLMITGSATILEPTMDERCAKTITRYAVVGTVGSLYRPQSSAVTINNNYYSDEYGINFTSASGGVKLEEGSTGFFDRTDISAIEYKWLYSKLIVDAFRGKIDPRIMSPNRTPAKYLFDGAWNTVVGQLSLPTMNYSAADIVAASTMYTEDEKDTVLFNPSITEGWDGNTDVDVKQAMYDLMDYRVYQGIPEDKRPLGPGSGLSLHLDSGVTDEATATLINKSFIKRFDNPNASWDIGGIVSSRDGIAYTFTKFIVDNLVRHCKTNTVNKPFTGIYTKILKNEYVSYFPDIDTTDWEYRELMYNSGGNAWLPDVNGTLMRRSQRTLMRGSDTSDLIQESNMRTLSQLVYLLQNKLDEKLFEYNDDSVLRTMQDEVNNMFSNWAGNMVESLNISFQRDINPNDGGEVVVCYVDVVFRGINLRIPVIVNVNRRITSTT